MWYKRLGWVLGDQHQMWTKIREPAITAFLLWHFTATILWLSPASPLRDQLLAPFIGYLNFFGLWQGWSVFEKPRNYNVYLTALVTLKDGSQKPWDFPRMDKLGILEKMHKERYRKWVNDSLNDDSKSYLWPDAVRYIARLHNSPGNPPLSVSIIRHWSFIPPPEKGLGKPLPDKDDGQYTLYTQKISPEDLR